MNEDYYPPIFLSGELPKRIPDEIIWLILCLKRMGIVLPKDLLRMIYYEFLHVVAFVKTESRFIHSQIYIEQYDFAIIDVLVGEAIFFNDCRYPVSNGKKYLICPKLDWLYITIRGDEYSVIYYSFVDRRSPLAISFSQIMSRLNSDIDGTTLMYLDKTIRKDNDDLEVFSKKNNPELQQHIDVCLKYGVITLEDPLPSRKPRYYIDEAETIYVINQERLV